MRLYGPVNIMRVPFFIALLCWVANSVWALDSRGELGTGIRYFSDTGDQVIDQYQTTLYGTTEVWHSPNQNQDIFTFSPYVRLDSQDDNRHLFDFNDLSWVHVRDNLELRAGIRQVYWGVTEGLRLVDVINQTDIADDIKGDRKLGQPMINLSVNNNEHIFDFFLLLGHRQPTFVGEVGRLRLPLIVDADQATWESRLDNQRTDIAARWQWTAYPIWLGISAFSGTSREPELTLSLDPSKVRYSNNRPIGFVDGYEPVFAPYYPLINQLGIDFQANQGDILWKLEAIQRWGGRQDYHAINAGLEYTQVGLFESKFDLGWLAEALYDSRGRDASTPFDQDILVGWRLALNDLASTELLTSLIIDSDSKERLFSLKGKRRLADDWSITLEVRQIAGTPPPQSIGEFLSNPDSHYALRPFSKDSYAQLQLSWFF